MTTLEEKISLSCNIPYEDAVVIVRQARAELLEPETQYGGDAWSQELYEECEKRATSSSTLVYQTMTWGQLKLSLHDNSSRNSPASAFVAPISPKSVAVDSVEFEVEKSSHKRSSESKKSKKKESSSNHKRRTRRASIGTGMPMQEVEQEHKHSSRKEKKNRSRSKSRTPNERSSSSRKPKSRRASVTSGMPMPDVEQRSSHKEKKHRSRSKSVSKRGQRTITESSASRKPRTRRASISTGMPMKEVDQHRSSHNEKKHRGRTTTRGKDEASHHGHHHSGKKEKRCKSLSRHGHRRSSIADSTPTSPVQVKAAEPRPFGQRQRRASIGFGGRGEVQREAEPLWPGSSPHNHQNNYSMEAIPKKSTTSTANLSESSDSLGSIDSMAEFA